MAVLSAAQRSAGPQLLGNDLQVAREILRRNLLGDRFPGFWMETPLLGAPGFDFHVSYDRPDLPVGVRFSQGDGFGHQRLVDWFVSEETGGVGLGFAHDILTGPDGVRCWYSSGRSALLVRAAPPTSSLLSQNSRGRARWKTA